MRWLVYGAGAVGGVLGARLHEAGHDVVLVARGEHLRAIRERGLTLATPEGSRTLHVPVVGTAAELAGDDATTVLLTVKSHQTQAAVEDLAAAGLTDRSPVVSLQNGVANEPHLLRWFADVSGVCVMMPTGHLEPGVVEQHSSPLPGVLDIGRFPAGSGESARLAAEAFASAGFVSEVRDDIMAWKHRKLVLNLGNAVDACCRPSDETSRLADLAREEGEAVLAAAGIDVVTAEHDRRRRGDLLQVRGVPGRARGGDSSWQSLKRGTGTIESDYLNGEIVLVARRHGSAAPVNDLLRRTAVDLARAGRPPGSVDAADLLARLER